MRKTLFRFRMVPCIALAMATSPAHANGAILVSDQISSLIHMMVTVPNLCISYSYDANGNRIVQTNAAYGTPGAVWGTAVYACFNWTTP